MHFRKSIFLFSLLEFIFFSSSALAAQWGDFTYRFASSDNNTVEITGYTGDGGAVVIPDNITDMPVVSIGYAAFSNTSITGVIIPCSVTNIGIRAFSDTGLTSVAIPGSVTSIGILAFEYCPGMTSIDVDASNTAYSSQDGVLYNKAMTMLVRYPNGKSGGFTIPGSVTRIESYSFVYCFGLTSVAIPGSVTSIGDFAFEKCSALTSIDVDASNTAYSSQDGVLYNKAMTMLMRYPNGKSGDFTIPGSVTSIETHAFCFSKNLISIIIPGSVTSIGDTAIYSCTSLTSAYFYGYAPTMGGMVFDVSASGFKAYYLAGATGFTNPWYGYPTALFTDMDRDGVPDAIDNCPTSYNPLQGDTDGDSIGNVCDITPGCGGCGQTACENTDADNDGIIDNVDNCPNTYNPLQRDADDDGIGDACDPTPGCGGGCGQPVCEGLADTDNDFLRDALDNCPNVFNPNQLDANGNGTGDCCDADPGCGGTGQQECDTFCSL